VSTWIMVITPSLGVPMQGQQSVALGNVTQIVTLPTPVPGVYNVYVTPNWETTIPCIAKTANNFTVEFGTPAPALASFDWRVE
jgi:hypothetical protein